MANFLVPAFTTFFDPIMATLQGLGNSGSLSELREGVAIQLGLDEDALNLPHYRNRGKKEERVTPETEFAYRLRWALTYLKKAGFVQNSERGVWAFTDAGAREKHIDRKKVIAAVRAAKGSSAVGALIDDNEINESFEVPFVEQSWKTQMLDVLMAMPPAAFERLAQRLLREAGFDEVEVTGKTGDGGIDGRGTIRLNNLVGITAVFQCKRYRAAIGPDEIRGFRGAMAGRADKGLFLTTARFTVSARREASRDGAATIELIDGDSLADLLKKLGLGVAIEQIEVVTIEPDFFAKI